MGGRWAGSDSELLLRYQGGEEFVLRAYMAPSSFYRLPRPLSGRVVVQDCGSMPFSFEKSSWREFRLPLRCRLPEGKVLRVRILLDNTFDLPRLFDRQRSMVVQRAGFGPAS